MTLESFRIKKTKIDQKKSSNYIDFQNVSSVYNYDGLEIALLKNGQHYLIIGTEEYTGNLEHLESILFQWYQEECITQN